MRAPALAAAALAASWSAAAAAPCAQEIGRARAAALLGQCREVSLAALPPCRPETACQPVREEIARGCRLLGADAPSFCEAYVEPDPDEDDDD